MKERLDILLTQKGYFDSREKARRAIMAGVVFIDNQKSDKAGTLVDIESQIFIKEKANPYVSRGGLKLEKGIRDFGIRLEGKICMDIGASTGGFTDCMLQSGAQKVYAIDVGYGQLAWKLREDARVVCMERTNFRYVKPEDITELIDFASVDVSFISLKLMLPAAYPLLADGAQMLCLIKPQFEAGREKVGKKGVVRDPKVHEEVLKRILGFTLESGFILNNLTYSPIKGPEGNIEYLMYITKDKSLIPTQKELHREMTGEIINDQKLVSNSAEIEHLQVNISDLVNTAFERLNS